jgi:hypothetical protein
MATGDGLAAIDARMEQLLSKLTPPAMNDIIPAAFLNDPNLNLLMGAHFPDVWRRTHTDGDKGRRDTINLIHQLFALFVRDAFRNFEAYGGDRIMGVMRALNSMDQSPRADRNKGFFALIDAYGYALYKTGTDELVGARDLQPPGAGLVFAGANDVYSLKAVDEARVAFNRELGHEKYAMRVDGLRVWTQDMYNQWAHGICSGKRLRFNTGEFWNLLCARHVAAFFGTATQPVAPGAPGSSRSQPVTLDRSAARARARVRVGGGELPPLHLLKIL